MSDTTTTMLHQQFFALLRNGLFGIPLTSEMFANADWPALLELAKQQTVEGILYEAITHLPANAQPPRSLLMTLFARIVAIEQTHERLNKTLKHVHELYRSNGINSVLLKGQGVASCYPTPTRRVCGDIDLYVGKEQFRQTNQIAEQNGFVQDNTPDNVKHAHFDFQGVSIENHKRVNVLFRIGANLRFQRYIKESIFTSNRSISVYGETVMLPPAEADIIISFIHLFIHFVEGGLGLRQICDFTMLLNKYGKEIDQKKFVELLDQFRLTTAWQIFTPIAVMYLGLDADKVPAFSTRYKSRSEKAINIVLDDGNFGRKRTKQQYRPNGYFTGKLVSLVHQLGRRRKIFAIQPIDATLYSFIHLYNGLYTILSDKILCRIKK